MKLTWAEKRALLRAGMWMIWAQAELYARVRPEIRAELTHALQGRRLGSIGLIADVGETLQAIARNEPW